jgi:hypothetical protein
MADKDMPRRESGQRDDRESGEPVQLDREKQGQQMPPRPGEAQKQGGAPRPEQPRPEQQRPEQPRPEHQSK